MVQRVDKDSLKLDQPRRTPGHPTKSHIVKTRVDGKEKIIRFGEQGAETAGKPKEGESERMKTKRASFKARHAKNIAKGKSSPAYWANKVKWADGGAVTGMAVGGGWGQMAAAGPVGGSAKVASDAVQARESLARAAASMREAYGGQPTSTRPAAVTARDDRAAPGTYSGTGVRGFTYDAGDPELGIRPSIRLNGDDVAPGMRDLARSYGVDDGEDYVPASLTQPVVAVRPVAPIAEQPAQAPGFFAQLLQAPKAIGQDLMMGYRAGIFSPRDVQEQNLLRAEYTPAAIADYFARTDATRARMDAAAPSGIDRSEAMPAQGDLAQAFAREYNIVGRNRSQLMPLLEAFLRGRGITDPSTYADNIFNTLSIPMQQGGAVELNEIYQKYMPFTSDRDMIGQMERYLENIRRAQGGADEQAKRERDVVIGAFAPPPRPTPNDYLREKGATPEIEGYRQAAIKAAEKYGIPPNIFLSLVRTESNFNPLAKSGKGAMGLVQLMPKTAEELGVTDPFDPMQNLDGGARYLAQQYNRFGEWPLALSAYNAGASNVLKYDGIPPFEETKNYVDKVMRGAGILKYADGGAVEAEDDPSFFSLSGQERRRALDDLNARIGESLRYYLGPTPIPQILGLASEMTPSRTVERASEASQRMVEPGLSPLERIGAGAEMLGEVAAVGAPLAVGARGAMPMAEAAQEAFMGLSVPARAAAQEIADRLNQPGPMPVLGSNFGNIGQGRPTIADLQSAQKVGQAGRSLEIRPSSDNIDDVIDANAKVGLKGQTGFASVNDLRGGVDLTDADQKKRVDRLVDQISGPDGYFERIIIDGQGNVVEGQHRLEAARRLNMERIPVVQMLAVENHIDEQSAVDAIMSSYDGNLRREQANDILRNVAEDVMSGQSEPYKRGDLPDEWLAPYNTALEYVRGMNVFPVEKDKSRVMPFSEAPVARSSYAAPRPAATVGGPTSSYSGDLQEAPLAEMPRITPSDLVGARIIPTVADLTRAGGYYRGIDASQIDVPEPMMGGPRYPLLPSSQQAGLAWAVQGKSMGTKKGLKGADLIAVTAMNPTSHKSNISFINSLIKTTGAYVRDDRIPPQVLGELDARVRAASTGPGLSNLETFPGFESPNLQEWINNASFEDRSRIADIIATKEMQGLGLPNVNRVLQETVDPRYAGANPRDTLFFIEPDFSLPVVDLRAEGLPIHPSYRYGLRGRVFGALDQNISTFEMFPEFWGEKNVSAFGPNFDKGGRRAFDLSIPITDFTNQRAEEIERIIRSSASNYGPTRAAARLSPIDTRIVVNSMLDRWKPSTKPVNAGGVSPQAFADAINNSKYRPALTNYTAADVKAGAKSGDFTVYQLGDDEVFFGIDAKPDYSWAGVEMMPGDKALVGVVSNAPGAKGTAAPSVMAKAIEEGVTVLDAFAVPSQKFPDGFLPEYYGKFGFQEVGRVPFDPELYIADHGEQAYKDLRAAWKSDGWDENMGMPPVIVMRWSGNDADRRAAATGIRGAGSPSTRAEPEGFIPEAEGFAGRGGERSVPSEPSSVGRGASGSAGVGDAVRLAARAGEPAAGILGLSPRELQNRGISRDQIKDLARKYELDLPPDFARGGTVRVQPKGYAAGGLVTPFDPAMIDQIVNRVKGAARV